MSNYNLYAEEIKNIIRTMKNEEKLPSIGLILGSFFMEDYDLEHTKIYSNSDVFRRLIHHNRETGVHSLRVAIRGAEICNRISKIDLLEDVVTSCLFHDCGKTSIPNSILRKPSSLSSHEYALIKLHPIMGSKELYNNGIDVKIIDYISKHHERLDGSGYPFGLYGKDIHKVTKVVSIADSIDAMIMNRTYSPGFRPKEVINELVSNSGIQFDSEIVAKIINTLTYESIA